MKVLRESVDLNLFSEDIDDCSNFTGFCCLTGVCCKGC